jgi:hypothetical protein
MRYKGLERGGFAPQCRIIFGEATEPERAAVEKWIDARSKFSNFEGPNPGDCPSHLEGEPARTPRPTIAAVLTTYRVGWAHSDQRQEVEAQVPQEAAERWLAGHTDDRSTLITTLRRLPDPVVVGCPDGTELKFKMTARIVWAAEEVKDV